jgi:hypothetical protein
LQKGNIQKKKRLILDLSAPHNDHDISINGLIDRDKCSMSYIKIDDAIKIITQYGKSALLCKYDISDAFKSIPVKSDQWPLLCMKWKSSYYYYVRLSFGCRLSPIIFDTLSRVICYIAEKNYKIKHILHLLDDFLTIDPPNYTTERTMALMTMIFNRLNIPLATHQTLGPTTCLEYLGIILDIEKLEARLPQDKVDRICEFIKIILHESSCTKRELLQLLGHMNFATCVIIPGRSFVSYLIELSTSVTVKELHYYVHLNKECRVDLQFYPFLKVGMVSTCFMIILIRLTLT